MSRTRPGLIQRMVNRYWRARRRPTIRVVNQMTGEVATLEILGTTGLYLNCQPIGGAAGRFLVSDQEAYSRREFWLLWRAWGGGPLYWEDGKRYKPWRH